MGTAINKRNRGQGLVEFALILPIFLLLLFGMVEFGRAYMTKNILTGAAREAARQAVVQTDNVASLNVATSRATEVLNSANIGVPPAVVIMRLYDINDDGFLEVEVTYPFPIIIGGFFGFTGPGNQILLRSVTSMRRERY